MQNIHPAKCRVDIGLFCQNVENFGRSADDMIGREELFSLAEAPGDADNLGGAHILACFYVNSGIADEGALFGREAQRREHRKRRVGCRLQRHAVSATDYQIKGIGEEMCNGILCYSILLIRNHGEADTRTTKPRDELVDAIVFASQVVWIYGSKYPSFFKKIGTAVLLSLLKRIAVV